MAFSFNATFPKQLLLISKSQISKSDIFEVVLVCDFTFSQKFRLVKSRKKPFSIRVYRAFAMVFNWG